MRYRFEGKEKPLAIGPYPEISLTEARAKRSEAKIKLPSGVEAAEQKQASQLRLLILQLASGSFQKELIRHHRFYYSLTHHLLHRF
ncbi:Arm DNA-binding domain-containing protein [Cronobacter dublinensis]|uniref:Arm DNA-binding domain-containing protein n=1 Tax=Cronobacter dublinensis TaxID=413497 RepID=UPI001F3AC69E|nr:Arm DNA-binding domain-containing protein [Cronobacter dublinensis]MDK1254566.1 Arm DNA-binding domain-containing protein [Cronobacter dublinensis]